MDIRAISRLSTLPWFVSRLLHEDKLTDGRDERTQHHVLMRRCGRLCSLLNLFCERGNWFAMLSRWAMNTNVAT